MKTGIFPGTSRATYDAWPAMNISRLVHGKTMLHLKWHLDHPDRETTDALEFGIAAHLAVFEPAEFEKKVKCAPNCDKRTNAGKAKFAEFEASCNKGDTIIEKDAYDQVVSVRDALRNNPTTKSILDSKGVGEMAALWQDEETGVYCKGLVDRFCNWNGWSLIPDLKTCRDASESAFLKDVVNYHYHTKAAWYLDGLNTIAKAERRFIWIAIEKENPHAIALYEPDNEMLDEGRKNYRRMLNQYAACLKSNEWKGYPDGITPLTLPKWAKNKPDLNWE